MTTRRELMAALAAQLEDTPSSGQRRADRMWGHRDGVPIVSAPPLTPEQQHAELVRRIASDPSAGQARAERMWGHRDGVPIVSLPPTPEPSRGTLLAQLLFDQPSSEPLPDPGTPTLAVEDLLRLALLEG